MTTTTTAIIPTAELSALVVHAESVRNGHDVLLSDWCRLRTASARQTPDPLAGVTFGAVLEATITARVTGTPFALPIAKGK